MRWTLSTLVALMLSTPLFVGGCGGGGDRVGDG